MIHEILSKLRFLVHGKSKTDLGDELRFHVDKATEANVDAGMTPVEARRRALIDFGGLERAREQCHAQRPGWWLGTLAQDVRYALRGFRRNPVFTIAVIATLTVGIGATTAVFSVVDRVLFRPLPYAHDDRLVSVGLVAPILPQEFMLGGSYYEWRDNQKPFSAFTSETGSSACDLIERNPARLSCASVEQTFLPTLGVAPIIGRNFLPEEGRPKGPKVALISYGLWLSHYGLDPGILNRQIDIDGSQVRVVGVLPNDFEMPALEAADIVLPQALDEAAQRRGDPGRVMYAFARLKPGLTVAQAEAALQPVFNYSLNLAPAPFRKEVHLRVRSIRDRQMHDVRLAAWVLFGAVLAVMLIACANVSSLLIARAAQRERELAVRSALGASRMRLLRQTLTEALVLSLIGAASGYLLAEILLRVFIDLAPSGITLLNHAPLDARIIVFTMLGSLACGVVFGVLPALHAPHPIAATARIGGSGQTVWLRRGLVVAQIAVSMILLSGAALLARSFQNIEKQSMGIETHGVLAVRVPLPGYRYTAPQQRMEFSLRAEQALRRLPGVLTVGLSDSLPPGDTHGEQIYNNIAIEGRPREAEGTGGMVAWRLVSPEYFGALEIPIVRGQGFTAQQRTSKDHFVILSRLLAARMFGEDDPVGKRIQLTPNGPWSVVAGVAPNVKNAGLTGNDEPEYYRLRRDVAEDWNADADLVLKTSLDPKAAAPWIRTQIAQIDAAVPVQIETLSQQVSKLADRPRFETALLGFFALCGLLMAVIGLYGVIAFIATQRTQEIGVRMALGATRVDILRLIAGEGVRLIVFGGLVGVGVSLATAQLLKSLLFNVGLRDPMTYAAVVVLLGVVALAATLIPARAAMKVEPVVALRYE